MDVKYWIGLVICIVAACILGYLIGKNTRRDLKPKGDIVFETYIDETENGSSEAVRCTFKLDLDIDQIVNEDYILFRVVKDQKVLDFYKNTK